MAPRAARGPAWGVGPPRGPSTGHPGPTPICPARRALVLELVEGPTLADRISRGPIPIDEALLIAKQIAEALEAAHEAGIIHRDLKPANIKVRDDGTVKVLDFGLAKALDTTPIGDPSQSPTLTAAATQMGVIMETAAYMSPEQARGKSVDKRADIWAFGVVLYEMLTGQRAFEGEDVSMTLSRVLQQEPDWSRLPSAVSPSVSVFLQRCFKKDPKQRVHDVADVRLALEGAFDTGAGRSHLAPDSLRRGWQRPLPLAMAGLALVLIGGIGSHLVRPVVSSTSAGVTRFPIVLPADDQFDATRRLALSPDGAYLVYWANFQLYLRPLAQMEATPIGGTDRARDPFFSADGQWVGFWQFGQLKKVALAGGAPVTIGTLTVPSSGASWGTDDTILVGLGSAGVGLVRGTGGIPETLIEVAEGERASAPQMLPGGEWVLFTLLPSSTSSWNDASIVAQSLETSERRVLIAGGRDGRYVHTGHLVYALEGTLFAAPFNTQTISVMPGTSPLVEGIADDAGVSREAPFGLSNDGTLVYVPRAGAGETVSVLGWVDREGQMTPLTQAGARYQNPRISPDGSQVAVTIGSDAWLYDIERDASTRLTEEGSNSYPAWTPDGQRVTFSTDRSGTIDLYEKAVDGRGSAEPLLQAPTLLFPGSWSPDGTMFAFYEVGESGVERDIRILERGGETRTFLATEFNERIPSARAPPSAGPP